MTKSTDLDKIAYEARNVATSCGAMILDTVLSLEQTSLPVAHVGIKDFTALVRHIQPRIAYIFTPKFSAKQYILEYIESDQIPSGHAKNIIAKWSKNDGETFRVALGVIGDGVLHGLVDEAD